MCVLGVGVVCEKQPFLFQILTLSSQKITQKLIPTRRFKYLDIPLTLYE